MTISDKQKRKPKPILSAQERVAVTTLAPAPTICLVNPQMGENIGAAARAMANFGLEELRLVAPRDGWPNEKAIAVASGANWPIDKAQVFETTQEAISDKNLIFATSGTPRQIDKPLISPAQAISIIDAAISNGQKPIILFGSERVGLGQMDLIGADFIVTYPTDFRFPSLNLAQSVAIFCYLWATRSGDSLPDDWKIENLEIAERKYFDAMFNNLLAELDEVGFFWPEDRRINMVETLLAPMVKAGFSNGQVTLFRGAIKALVNGPRRRFLEAENERIIAEIRAWFEAQTETQNDLALAILQEIILDEQRATLIVSQNDIQRAIIISIENGKFVFTNIIPPY